VRDGLILIPFAGMFVLTFVVWVHMFQVRIAGLRDSGEEPQTRADLDRLVPRGVNSSSNFQNLFELPVVFYACVLALLVTNQIDSLHVVCAFGFFGFRIAHSVIHCTYNRVMHRFSVYAIASLFLWVMVFRLAFNALFG